MTDFAHDALVAMLTESESVLYCVKTKNKTKPEHILEKNTSHLRQKKKFYKLNAGILLDFTPNGQRSAAFF